MNNLNRLLDSVVMEGQYTATTFSNVAKCNVVNDAVDYNFMRAANRVMRKAELTFGVQLLNPVIERIADKTIDGPSVRLLLSSLMRLSPTRQAVYERYLTATLPNWRSVLEGNPQDPLPEEFYIASIKVSQQNIEFPLGLLEAVEKATQSSCPDVVITALKFFERAGIQESIGIVRKLIQSDNENIRVASILTAARLASLDKNLNTEILNLIVDTDRSIAERLAASEAVLGGNSFHTENTSVFIRDTLLSLKDANIFYDTLLDSGNTDILTLVETHIAKASVESLSESTIQRIIRVRNIAPKLRKFALDTLCFAAAASREQAFLERSRFGLIAHRNSSTSAAFIGHTGIFISETQMIDCSTGRGDHAVQQISFSDWKDNNECWGIREDNDHPVDLQKAVNRASEIASWRTEYDGTHNNQKGEWFKGWFCKPKYWESDCVGFTEHCYEFTGGNPTPNEFESGAGWPLTPREQRDHMDKVFDC